MSDEQMLGSRMSEWAARIIEGSYYPEETDHVSEARGYALKEVADQLAAGELTMEQLREEHADRLANPTDAADMENWDYSSIQYALGAEAAWRDDIGYALEHPEIYRTTSTQSATYRSGAPAPSWYEADRQARYEDTGSPARPVTAATHQQWEQAESPRSPTAAEQMSPGDEQAPPAPGIGR